MSIPFPPRNSTFSTSFLKANHPSRCAPPYPPCSSPPLASTPPQTWDYGFKRLVPLLSSPPVGAGILACAFFFFISFLSDLILARITPLTLGIVVTISTFALLILIILILFLL